MKKVVFCQPSTDLVRPDNPCLDYYREVYPMNEGYHMGRYFMEVPTWIAVVSGMLPDEHYEKELHIIQHVPHTIQYLRYMSEPCTINVRERDIQTMELLDVSRLNPLYILERIKYYISKRKK